MTSSDIAIIIFVLILIIIMFLFLKYDIRYNIVRDWITNSFHKYKYMFTNNIIQNKQKKSKLEKIENIKTNESSNENDESNESNESLISVNANTKKIENEKFENNFYNFKNKINYVEDDFEAMDVMNNIYLNEGKNIFNDNEKIKDIYNKICKS